VIFARRCILSIHQKKYKSISEYNNLIEILNKIYEKKTTKKHKKTNTSTKKIYVTFVYTYAGGLTKTGSEQIFVQFLLSTVTG
jgi:5-methylcytosine-specific restriction endonuclease McrBC regulatory subunit McrC